MKRYSCGNSKEGADTKQESQSRSIRPGQAVKRGERMVSDTDITNDTIVRRPIRASRPDALERDLRVGATP